MTEHLPQLIQQQLLTRRELLRRSGMGFAALGLAGLVGALVLAGVGLLLWPVALAMLVGAGTPVLLTCSDPDGQARCDAVAPMAAALAHTRLDFVALKGVSHVLKDDPSDSVTNYATDQPLSQEFVGALDGFLNH